MKKMLVSDYDDTFYLNDCDIKYNINLLQEYRNKIFFVIATGRSYHDYLKKRDKYNITSEYVIINHGASIIKNDEIIFNIEIDNYIKEKIIKDLNVEKSINNFGCSKKESRLNINSDNLTKINIKYNDKEYAIKIYNKINDKYSQYVNCYLISNNTALEIVSSKVSKKIAVLKIAELEKINIKNIYTVGDNDTDYDMLKCFNGYQMKKSSKKIRSLNLESVNSVSEVIKKIIN